jgi:hypothetical protein
VSVCVCGVCVCVCVAKGKEQQGRSEMQEGEQKRTAVVRSVVQMQQLDKLSFSSVR